MATEKEKDLTKKRPTLTLPPRPSMETLYGSGLSPGPMTLVSSFFSDESNYHSFTQLLAGAMASPLARQAPTLLVENDTIDGHGSVNENREKKDLGFKESRPRSLMVARSPLFTVPPGLSPSGLLNSPCFFSPQSPFGMSHQQALAQVTAQAVLAQSHMHMRPEYQPSSVSAPVESLTSHPSFTLDEASRQLMPPSTSDSQISAMEPPEVSHSDPQQPLAVDKTTDGYNWRKYGQKPIKGSEYPRSYYKCKHPSCPVTKKVEHSFDGQIAQIIYKNEHNHEKPQPGRRAKDSSDVNGNINSQAKHELVSQGPPGKFSNNLSETVPAHSGPGSNQVPSQAAAIQLLGSSESEELGDADNRKEGDDDMPNPKRRNIAKKAEVVVSHKMVTESKIIVQTRSEVDLLDDGYRWRKYGQKVVKGNPHPRSYYKCTSAGCNVRKHVERAPTDPKAVITTYEGKHNHETPAARNSNYNATNSNASQVRPHNVMTETCPLLKDTAFGNNGQRPVLLQLKEEQITV